MNYIFLTDGFEEIEGLTVIDLFRRADIEIKSISLTNTKEIRGRSDIRVFADDFFENIKEDEIKKTDFLILPGGTTDFINHKGLCDLLVEHHKRDGYIAAICAAPLVLGKLGILNNKEAKIYTTMKEELEETGSVEYKYESPVLHQNVITANGPAAAITFAFVIIAEIKGVDVVNRLAAEIIL